MEKHFEKVLKIESSNVSIKAQFNLTNWPLLLALIVLDYGLGKILFAACSSKKIEGTFKHMNEKSNTESFC